MLETVKEMRLYETDNLTDLGLFRFHSVNTSAICPKAYLQIR